jgi:hypothetical protein
MCRYVVTRRDHEGRVVVVGESDQFSEARALAYGAHGATGSDVLVWDEDDPTPLVKLDARVPQVAAGAGPRRTGRATGAAA